MLEVQLMFIVYALLLLGALVIVGLYVARRLDTVLAVLVPGLAARKRRWLIRGYYLAMYTLPTVMLCVAIYALLGPRRWIQLPEASWIDYLLIYPFWLVAVWSAQCTGYFLAIDVVGLVATRIRRRGSERWRRWHAGAIAAVAVIFAVYVPARAIHDGSAIDVRQTTLVVPGLPGEMAGLRIALVADLQADRYTDRERLEAYTDRVTAEQPDIVLIAGDLITRGDAHIELAAEAAGRMRARLGVYSCIGDHDNWAYGRDGERSVRAITEALARHGVAMIDDDVLLLDGRAARREPGSAATPAQPGDTAARVPATGHSLAVLFVTDNYMNRTDTKRLDAMLEKTREARVRVLLSHQPSVPLVGWAARNPIELFLAGHTHGGQITLVYPFWRFTPASLESPYVRGSFSIADLHLIVSSGVGVSVAPFRYNSTPTIDIITLASDGVRARP